MNIVSYEQRPQLMATIGGGDQLGDFRKFRGWNEDEHVSSTFANLPVGPANNPKTPRIGYRFPRAAVVRQQGQF